MSTIIVISPMYETLEKGNMFRINNHSFNNFIQRETQKVANAEVQSLEFSSGLYIQRLFRDLKLYMIMSNLTSVKYYNSTDM